MSRYRDQITPNQSLQSLVLYPQITPQLYSRIALSALKVPYSDVGDGGVAVKCEKTHFFLNTLYMALARVENMLRLYLETCP